MQQDPYLIERMQNILKSRSVEWEEKKMMGGLCFMVDDKMCFGTYKKGLMARVDPEESSTLQEREGAEPLIHGGRPMMGFMMLEPIAYDRDEDLEFWIDKCLEFNPKAKSSKKKKK